MLLGCWYANADIDKAFHTRKVQIVYGARTDSLRRLGAPVMELISIVIGTTNGPPQADLLRIHVRMTTEVVITAAMLR